MLLPSKGNFESTVLRFTREYVPDSDAEYFRGDPEYLMVSLDTDWGMWRWPRAT